VVVSVFARAHTEPRLKSMKIWRLKLRRRSSAIMPLSDMKPRSATLQGFKAMFGRPSLGLSEIAWRWSFGFGAVVLLLLAGLEYLDTLPVRRAELFLLRTQHPLLVSRAIARIFAGSAPRAVAVGMVLTLSLAIGWIVLASLGRAATLKALFEYFQDHAVSGRIRLNPLMGLNLLRVILTLGSVTGGVGALLVAGAASPATDPSPGAAALIFFTLAMFVTLIWTVLNWFLSVASIFSVEGGFGTFGCVAATVGLCRTQTGAVVAAATWFGLAHFIALLAASSVIAFPLAFAELLPAGIVLGGVLLVGLLYFAIVDFLYVGRLASYVYMLKGPQEDALANRALPGGNISPIETRVDAGELILGDLPAPGMP
jgi:hypothetical protein